MLSSSREKFCSLPTQNPNLTKSLRRGFCRSLSSCRNFLRGPKFWQVPWFNVLRQGTIQRRCLQPFLRFWTTRPFLHLALIFTTLTMPAFGVASLSQFRRHTCISPKVTGLGVALHAWGDLEHISRLCTGDILSCLITTFYIMNIWLYSSLDAIHLCIDY